MRLQIGTYEVDIKVKGQYSKKANKTDTQYFLNELAIAFGEAARRQEQLGRKASAKHSWEYEDNIYDRLEAEGFYK